METSSVSGILSKEEKVIAIVARETCSAAEEITLSTRLEEIGVDSLEFLNLIICIKQEVGEIPENLYHLLNTVGDIVLAIR